MTESEIVGTTSAESAVMTPSPRRRARRGLALVVAVLGLASAAGAVGYLKYQKLTDPMPLAEARLESGDPAAARLLLLNILHTRPNDAEACLLLGRVNLRLGDPLAAEHILREAGRLHVGATRLRQPLAAALLAQTRSQEALDLLITDGATLADLPVILVARAAALEQLHDIAGADAALNEAGRLAPQLIDVPLASAGLALRRGDLVRAEGDTDKALLMNGRSADALSLKAQMMERRGQRSGAIDFLTKALTADPKVYRVRLERARMLLSVGRTADAQTDVDALLAVEPANVAAIYLKANVLMENHDYGGADSLLQKVAHFVPVLPRGWYAVAKAKLNLEQLEQATEAVDKYVALAPGDLDGHKLQARVGLAAKRPGKALEALYQITSTGTADAETFDLVGDAQAMAGRFAQAASSFSHAAALAPKNPGVYAHLGLARLFLGDSPGAVEALERSLRLAPEQLEVSKQLVVAAVASGTPERAATFLANLRQRTGETASTGQLEALLALAQLDPSGAANRLADIATKFPDNNDIKLQLSRVLLMQGRVNDAESVLVTVLAQEPAQDAALNLLIPILERSGRVPRAAAILATAHSAAPGNPNLTLMLAGLHARAGDLAAALAALRDDSVQHDSSPTLLPLRAAMELAAGQPAAARKTYEDLLRFTPARPDLVVRFAAFLVTQGALEEAGQQLASGLTASPGNLELQRALVHQRYVAEGLDAALSAADALRREPANLPAAALLRGDVLLAAGKTADAADAYDTELTKAPSSILAMQAAAAANAAHGPILAVQLLRSWMQAHPDDLSAMEMLSSMLTTAKRPDAAATVLESLLARQPYDTRLMNNLALTYYELGDSRAYPLALRAYLSTFSPPVADTLGCILLAAGRTQEALTLLRFAGQALPGDLPVQLHLAQATRQAGLPDEARILLMSLAKQQFDGRATASQLLADMQTH